MNKAETEHEREHRRIEEFKRLAEDEIKQRRESGPRGRCIVCETNAGLSSGIPLFTVGTQSTETGPIPGYWREVQSRPGFVKS